MSANRARPFPRASPSSRSPLSLALLAQDYVAVGNDAASGAGALQPQLVVDPRVAKRTVATARELRARVCAHVVLSESSDKGVHESKRPVALAARRALDAPRGGRAPPPSATLALRSSCLLYTSPSPRDRTRSRMPSSA